VGIEVQIWSLGLPMGLPRPDFGHFRGVAGDLKAGSPAGTAGGCLGLVFHFFAGVESGCGDECKWLS
jgi:hypothetical protein